MCPSNPGIMRAIDEHIDLESKRVTQQETITMEQKIKVNEMMMIELPNRKDVFLEKRKIS